MKIKNLLFAFHFFILSSVIFGQDFAVDKKATIISIKGSFMTSGGSLYENYNNERAKLASFSTSFNHFVTRNFFIGGGLEFSSQAQGVTNNNATGIGPFIGYAFGNSNSTAFPYLDFGLMYYSVNTGGYQGKASGLDTNLNFGVIFPIKSHVGLTFEAGYHYTKLKGYGNSSIYGDVLSLGIGFVGLIF